MDATGVPLHGPQTLTSALYDGETTVKAVWSESLTVDFEHGYYAVDLGTDEANPITGALFDGDLFLEVEVNGQPFERKPLSSSPYALRAATVDSVAWDQLTDIPTGLDDGDDDSQLTEVSWSMLTDVPPGLDDGDDDTQVTELSWAMLTDVPTGLDDGDDDSQLTEVSWSMLTDIPEDLADGDQDTQLTEVPWSMLTGVPDGIDDGDDDTQLTEVSWSMLTDVPAGLADGDDDNQLTSVPWSMLTSVPGGLEDGDDDTTYEASTGLTLSDGAFAADQSVIEGWAEDVAYDTKDELTAALSGEYVSYTNGKVGINQDDPKYDLDVDGYIHAKGLFVNHDGHSQTGGTGDTWLRVASGTGRSYGDLRVNWTASSMHGTLRFQAGCNYPGENRDCTVNVLYMAEHSVPGVKKIRVVRDGIYDAYYLDILSAGSSVDKLIWTQVKDNIGWTLQDMEPAPDPGGSTSIEIDTANTMASFGNGALTVNDQDDVTIAGDLATTGLSAASATVDGSVQAANTYVDRQGHNLAAAAPDTWLRLAKATGVSYAKVRANWTATSQHGTVVFTAGCDFPGTSDRCTVNVLHKQDYSVPGLEAVRIVRDSTYEEYYLEILAGGNTTGNNMVFEVKDVHGWTVLDVDESPGIPSGYTADQTDIVNIKASFGSGALTVDSIGQVGVGTTQPAYDLEVQGTTANISGAWVGLSDRRLKRDIAPLTGAVETLKALRGVTYHWKDPSLDERYGQVRGFIAQEVETVEPNWVRTGTDGYKRIETTGLNALLVSAVQEQQDAIDALRLDNEALRDELTRPAQAGAMSNAMWAVLFGPLLFLVGRRSGTRAALR
jgi:hypothetical protein